MQVAVINVTTDVSEDGNCLDRAFLSKMVRGRARKAE